MSPASLPVGLTAGLRLRGQCGSGQHRIDILVGPPSGGPGPVAPGNPPRENRRGRGLATRGSLAAQRGRRSPPGRPSRAPKGVPLRAAHAAARRMLLLCGCRASDAHYGEERPPWPPTAPRAVSRASGAFARMRTVPRRRCPSVPPPARPQGHRKEEPVPGGLESHHQRGQEGSVAKFGVNCAILPCHGAASETDA